MEISQLSFKVFSNETEMFYECIILVRNESVSIALLKEVSQKLNANICSEIDESDVWIDDEDMILALKGDGCLIKINDIDRLPSFNGFRVPKFDEEYIQTIIERIGGKKIQESEVKTPDFDIDGTVIELKNIELESLLDGERRNAIDKIFCNSDWSVINLDLELDLGEYTRRYKRLIENAIKYRVKDASKQIKARIKTNKVDSAGMILLNTGMYSLPHCVAKNVINKILLNDTKSVEFVYLISQVWQSNWADSYFVIQNEVLGKVNSTIVKLTEEFDKSLECAMTDMIRMEYHGKTIDPVKPISYFLNDRLYFWSPGHIPFNWNIKAV